MHLNVFWTYMCRRAQIIPYSLVYTYFCRLLPGFHNPQGNDICSSFLSIPSGSLSFINVLICLPVLSPHLDQFSPLADLAKHLALTLMQPHEGEDSNYTLLAFVISPASTSQGLALVVRISSPWISPSWEISRSALTDFKKPRKWPYHISRHCCKSVFHEGLGYIPLEISLIGNLYRLA